jgi:hypothetical protein
MSDPQQSETLQDIQNRARLLKLRSDHKIRAAFITCFQGTGDYGALVLATIGKKCGVEMTEAGAIDPSLTAFWNWLMVMLGIRTEDPNENLTLPKHYQSYIAEAKVLLSTANMNDVTEELTQIGGTDAGTE